MKTNIGHALEGAGISGLVKMVLSLHHRQLPPSLHFQTPNRHIPFGDSPFYVNTQLREWSRDRAGSPLRGAVSSFGFSGTNCHVICEEWPAGRAAGQSSLRFP